MSLVTFHPEQALDPFFNFDSDQFFNTKQNRWRTDAEAVSPKVNVTEYENVFHLEAETPGMKDKDISIEVHNGVLTIKGHKENKSETENENYHIREFSSQSFERSFKLSDRVDTEKVSAKIDDGVLKVDLPKHEQIKPKKIEVQSN
jgi:HSP20 family protein